MEREPQIAEKTAKSREQQLDEATRAIMEKAQRSTREEILTKFKKIGVVTKEGTLAPEYQGLGGLLTAGSASGA